MKTRTLYPPVEVFDDFKKCADRVKKPCDHLSTYGSIYKCAIFKVALETTLNGLPLKCQQCKDLDQQSTKGQL